MNVDVDAARDLALATIGADTDRARHCAGAAAAAAHAQAAVPPDDRALLVAAAWLHDVGYAAAARSSGFHPLDGARMLAARGWPLRLAALVAHHSEARFSAAVTGIGAELSAFPRETGPVADALTYADMCASADGRRVSIHERLRDMRRRHADDSLPLREARALREPFLVLAVARTELRLLAQAETGAPRPGAGTADRLLTPRRVAYLTERHPHRPRVDVLAALHAASGRLRRARGSAHCSQTALAHDLLEATSDAGARCWPLWSA